MFYPQPIPPKASKRQPPQLGPSKLNLCHKEPPMTFQQYAEQYQKEHPEMFKPSHLQVHPSWGLVALKQGPPMVVAMRPVQYPTVEFAPPPNRLPDERLPLNLKPLRELLGKSRG